MEMAESKRSKRDYTTVSIPMNLIQRIDDAVKSDRFGYQNRSDLILEAIRTRLRELGMLEEKAPEPTLEHFNLNENGVLVLDRSLEPPHGKVVTVYFKQGTIFCGEDETDSCKHVDFALQIPDVQKTLRKKGWKPK